MLPSHYNLFEKLGSNLGQEIFYTDNKIFDKGFKNLMYDLRYYYRYITKVY